MHWVTELWSCPECRVEVGQVHHDGCAMRNTAQNTVWQGPPPNPGLIPRLVVAGDVVSMLQVCQHCQGPIVEGEVVFETPLQNFSLHAACVLVMASVVPRHRPSPTEIEEQFERRRAEILSEQQ